MNRATTAAGTLGTWRVRVFVAVIIAAIAATWLTLSLLSPFHDPSSRLPVPAPAPALLVR